MRRPIDPFTPSKKPARVIPFDFVLEQLASLEPATRPMFGCLAIYLEERIVFVLRRKGDSDDGVWVAYEPALEQDVLKLLPRLQRIELLGNSRGWRKLAADDPGFEEDVLRACASVCSGDRRLGKLPESRKNSPGRLRAQR